MSDNYDPLTTQTAAITFRRLDALQDAIAAFGKTSSGSPVAILVAADGTLQTRRLNRLSDEVVLIGTDSTGTARPLLVDSFGRLALGSVGVFFLGPGGVAVQGKADADGTMNVDDVAARATLASILSAVQSVQPRSVSNFPADFPDATAAGRLLSILAQLDITQSSLRDAITGAAPNAKTIHGLSTDLAAALQATQPRSVTNFPADYPDAAAQARLASILGQLNLTTTGLRDALAASIATDQPRHLTNWPIDFPDALAEYRLGSLVTQLDRTLSEIFDVKAAQGTITAAANTAGLTVMVDLGPTGRTAVERFISTGGAATVFVQVSRDETSWRTVETQSSAFGFTSCSTLPANGYRYARIMSTTPGIALEFELSGAR